MVIRGSAICKRQNHEKRMFKTKQHLPRERKKPKEVQCKKNPPWFEGYATRTLGTLESWTKTGLFLPSAQNATRGEEGKKMGKGLSDKQKATQSKNQVGLEERVAHHYFLARNREVGQNRCKLHEKNTMWEPSVKRSSPTNPPTRGPLWEWSALDWA